MSDLQTLRLTSTPTRECTARRYPRLRPVARPEARGASSARASRTVEGPRGATCDGRDAAGATLYSSERGHIRDRGNVYNGRIPLSTVSKIRGFPEEARAPRHFRVRVRREAAMTEEKKEQPKNVAVDLECDDEFEEFGNEGASRVPARVEI